MTRLGMTPFRRMSIRDKFTTITMFISSTVLLIASLIYLANDYARFSIAIERELTTMTEIIAQNSLAAVAFDDPGLAARNLESLRANPDLRQAFILLPDGRVFANTPASAAPRVPPAIREGVPLRIDGTVTLMRSIALDGEPLAALYVTLDLGSFYGHFRLQVGIVITVMVLALLVALWMSSRMQQTIRRPILKLAAAMQRVSQTNDYSEPIERDSDDEIGMLVDGFAQMLAEIKAHDRELSVARHQAEAASRAKSTFVANMSHELRTPLNVIIGFSEIMAAQLLGPIGSAQYRTYAADIHSSGTHLLAIINSILDLSKVEAGRLDLKESAIDLHDLAGALADLYRERADHHGVALANEMPPDAPKLLADERLIRQCLTNLVSNALKFTPSGGRCAIAAGLGDKGTLDIAVTDTGIGIATADIETALAPFCQIDSAFDRRYDGTGLGLSIVKSFVDLHGGELRIESQPGQGTTVTMRFPSSRVLRDEAQGCLAAG